ncbi:MAG TPA: S41 family peptidase [Candidatus Lustribacter sp.]
MPARIRLLLAAAIVALSAWGGAAYAGRAAADPSIVTDRPMANLNLNALLGSGDPNKRVIETAYEQVQHSYYEPVNAQRLVDGETKALNCLITDCVKRPATVGHGPLTAGHATGSTVHDLALIEGAVDTVTAHYPKAGSKAQVTDAAIGGMLGGLGDPYTTYLNADAIRALDEELKGGNFGGIGVYIGKDPKSGAILVDPIEGNPAIRAGVRTGDAILAVNNQLTAGLPLDDVERRIRGPRGTVVALRVKRHTGNAIATIRVTRDVVHVPSVRAKIEDGFSYVRLSDFGQTSADEVRDAFVAAKKKGVKGYILDLRNNGGGLLDAAVDISSLVIHQGPIVATIDRAGHREVRSATGRAIDPLPLVVLVNKYTASASEITAGALQDDHLATLVGTKTFGKGVVQSLYQLDRGALKITTARYVTPKGRDIQHKGIIPDVVLDQRVDVPIIDTPADKQLAAAKNILRQKASQ